MLPRVVDGVGILRGIEANIKNIDGGSTSPSATIATRHDHGGLSRTGVSPCDRATHTQAMINTIKAVEST